MTNNKKHNNNNGLNPNFSNAETEKAKILSENKKIGAVACPSNTNVDKAKAFLVKATHAKYEKITQEGFGYFIAGFSDAESCFVIKVSKSNKTKTEWRLDPAFEIGLSVKDFSLLKQIQSFFGVGTIRMNKRNNSAVYAVQSVKDLTNVIIPYFHKYPLISQKRSDFELFKSAVDIMNQKQHLNLEGLQEIVNLRASMNNGLTDKLKDSFSKTKPVTRAEIQFAGIPDPN